MLRTDLCLQGSGRLQMSFLVGCTLQVAEVSREKLFLTFPWENLFLPVTSRHYYLAARDCLHQTK